MNPPLYMAKRLSSSKLKINLHSPIHHRERLSREIALLVYNVSSFTLNPVPCCRVPGPFSPETYDKALMQRYFKYGKIFKETIAGGTVVHLFDPEYIQTVYQHEGKIPHIPPLLETTQMYRKYRNMSPGLGNMYV